MVAAPDTLNGPHHRADEWVPALCEQFSNATGWPLRYLPTSHVSESDKRPSVDAAPCWLAEVHDGQQLVGQLRLDRPHAPHAHRSFAAASELSKLLADLVGQVFAAKRRSTEDLHELAVFAHERLAALVPHGHELLGMIKQSLRAGLQLTGFRSACLFLLEPTTGELRLRAAHALESQEVPRSIRPLQNEPPDLHVLTSGTRIVIRRGVRQFDEWLPRDAALGLCLPVQASCGVLGTLWFFDRNPRPISSREKRLLDSLAEQIASLLERVVLQRESHTHERLRQELLSLGEAEFESPIKSLRRPNVEATWRVSSRYEIGGDLCELVELSDHEVALTIGDATGSSVPAAVVMTSVHGALAALLAGDHAEVRDTARVLERVNRSLFRTRRLPHFMSLVYGVLNTQSLQFTYTNAGHPSPLLLRDNEVISLDSRGLLLGIDEEPEYTSETIALQPSDLLVGYSDGVSEARSVDQQFFGREGILKALRQRLPQDDTSTLLERVWNRQTAFARPGHADDRSLLIARVLPE